MRVMKKLFAAVLISVLVITTPVSSYVPDDIFGMGASESTDTVYAASR
ncbi:MAG: hypothetical protein K6E13_05065 [Lachnospiraceae bacterium]|nr:hypothetical protein [Lachnospiraceae bacterium]